MNESDVQTEDIAQGAHERLRIYENCDMQKRVKFKAKRGDPDFQSLAVSDSDDDLGLGAKRFWLTVKIVMRLRKWVSRKKAQRKALKEMMGKSYIEMVTEMQMARSENSRNEDPVLPKKPDEIKFKTLRQGMFIDNLAKGYHFMYKLHCNKDVYQSESSNGRDTEFTWSFFVKYKSKTTIVWQYHCFSDELMEQIYGNAKDNGQPTVDTLNSVFLKVAKSTVRMILEEGQPDWIDNLRQQIHLEL